MAGQLYRSQQETWSFITGANGSASTATKTDFSGGDVGVSATATIQILTVGGVGNIITAYVNKGASNILLGSYTVASGDDVEAVRNGLLASILLNAVATSITPSSTSTDTITLTALSSLGASANTWDVVVSIANNVVEPQHNVSVPNVGIFPFAEALLDSVDSNISCTQSTDNDLVILLSTDDWYVSDLKENDWLYLVGEKRRITHVFPSQQAVLIQYPFTATVTDEDVYVSYPPQNRHIKITAIGSANTATVDNVALKSGSFVQYDNNGGILPIVYTANGANEQLKFEVGI